MNALDRHTLDPADWPAVRQQAHVMLDDMLNYIEHIRERPVWQPMPAEVRASFQGPPPRAGRDIGELHDEFMRRVLPYAGGNTHPGFMSWVQSGGCVAGMLGEMVAAGLNANLGGRDHAPIEVEKQIVAWTRQWFGFPATASGLFVTGTSMANLLAVWVARFAARGSEVREKGVGGSPMLTAYTSREAHVSVPQAFDLSGLGSGCLRHIDVDAQRQLDLTALRRSIAADRAAGRQPFMVVGTAGTVNSGAFDDLDALADLCAEEKLWLHVDGAFGALAILSPRLAPRLRGVERADSIAFDFHKWVQVPFDAGFVLVKDGDLHRRTFESPAAYLHRDSRGLAAGSPWPCDFGPDLSRGFRALKTWYTLSAYGTERLGAMMEHTCDVAQHLARRVESTPQLELVAPVPLNIVCFRHHGSDELNARLVADLQLSGQAAPSLTHVDGRAAIRAAIFNHRTEIEDVERLLEATLELGARG
jgi:aromatic-L-amino-acid decarboxylase